MNGLDRAQRRAQAQRAVDALRDYAQRVLERSKVGGELSASDLLSVLRTDLSIYPEVAEQLIEMYEPRPDVPTSTGRGFIQSTGTG